MVTKYATIDEIDPADKIEHVSGTIEHVGGKLTFWLTPGRPKGVSMDEWEARRQANWERIFGKKK